MSAHAAIGLKDLWDSFGHLIVSTAFFTENVLVEAMGEAFGEE